MVELCQNSQNLLFWHNSTTFFPHPPVITPENLRNERKKGQTTIHKAAWPQLKISIPFTWFSFQFQEFQFQFHKFPISPIPVLKLELSHNSNSKTELPPNPEYYGSHFLVFLIRQYVWNTHLSLIGVIGENVTHTPRDTHTHRTHTHTPHTHTPHHTPRVRATPCHDYPGIRVRKRHCCKSLWILEFKQIRFQLILQSPKLHCHP